MATVVVIAGGKPPPSGHDPGTPFDIPKPTLKRGEQRGGEETYRENVISGDVDIPRDVEQRPDGGEENYREGQEREVPSRGTELREGIRSYETEGQHERKSFPPEGLRRIIERRTARGMSRRM